MHGGEENSYTVLVAKPEGKRLLWRPNYRWENNITVDLEALRWSSVDLIHLS